MRVFSVWGKRRAAAAGALFLTMLLLLLGAPLFKKTRVQKTAASARRLPVYSVASDEPEIALTFDCAWENSDTTELLALLSEYNVKATFFTTGDWCRRYPEDV